MFFGYPFRARLRRDRRRAIAAVFRPRVQCERDDKKSDDGLLRRNRSEQGQQRSEKLFSSFARLFV
jgi:hypothetical protein